VDRWGGVSDVTGWLDALVDFESSFFLFSMHLPAVLFIVVDSIIIPYSGPFYMAMSCRVGAGEVEQAGRKEGVWVSILDCCCLTARSPF